MHGKFIERGADVSVGHKIFALICCDLTGSHREEGGQAQDRLDGAGDQAPNIHGFWHPL